MQKKRNFTKSTGGKQKDYTFKTGNKKLTANYYKPGEVTKRLNRSMLRAKNIVEGKTKKDINLKEALTTEYKGMQEVLRDFYKNGGDSVDAKYYKQIIKYDRKDKMYKLSTPKITGRKNGITKYNEYQERAFKEVADLIEKNKFNQDLYNAIKEAGKLLNEKSTPAELILKMKDFRRKYADDEDALRYLEQLIESIKKHGAFPHGGNPNENNNFQNGPKLSGFQTSLQDYKLPQISKEKKAALEDFLNEFYGW